MQKRNFGRTESRESARGRASVHWGVRAEGIGRKGFLIVVGLMLCALPNFVVPRIATLNPAIHSKELLLRALLALAFWFAWLGRRSFVRGPVNMLELAIAGFVGSAFLAILTSLAPMFSLSESWHLALLPLVAIGLARARPSRCERGSLLALIALGAGVAAVYGFCVYFGYDFLRSFYPFAYAKGDARNYIHSFLGNPEYFGGYMAPVAVLCFGAALHPSRRGAVRVGWTVLCLFFLAGLVLSGTRGAFLGAAVGGAILGRSLYRTQSGPVRRRLLVLLSVLLLGLFVGGIVLSVPNPLNVRRMRLVQRFANMFDLGSDSVRERILFFCVASRLVWEKPVLGIGPGCFKLQFYPTVEKFVREDERAGFRHFAETLQGRVAEHAHNDYLEFMSEGGLVGFAAFSAVIAVLIWRFAARRRFIVGEAPVESSQTERLYEQTLYFAAIACLLFNALFSFPLHLPVRATLFWILVGLFLSVDREIENETARLG